MGYDNDFDLGLDFNNELNNMRPSDRQLEQERKERQRKKRALEEAHNKQKAGASGTSASKAPAQKPAEQNNSEVRESDTTPAHNMSKDEITRPETEGLQQSHDAETPGVDSNAVKEESIAEEFHHENEIGIDWRKFKTLDKMFEHVGGYRPVQLAPSIKKVAVSGAIEPLFAEIQKQLKARFSGAVIHFPWGEYEINDDNKVFKVKSTLIRYLMYDALRDAEGSHVQYAKQWLALNYTSVFDANFRPDIHIKASEDALDIYAVLFMAHTVDVEDGRYDDRSKAVSDALDGYQIETLEQMQMMNTSVSRVIDQLKTQDDLLRRQSERSQMMQTVLLLDRMGLLKGGVPRDVDGFAKLLEDSRDDLIKAETIVDHHIDGERGRQNSYDSDRRKQALAEKYK